MKKRSVMKLLSCILVCSMAVQTAAPASALAAEIPSAKEETVMSVEARAGVATKTLSTDAMDVKVAEKFPSIVQYDMKGDLAGKTFFGQTEEINIIRINDIPIQVRANDVQASFTDKKATYVISLKGTGANEKAGNVDCVLTVEISVDKNTASFDITKVENKLTEKDANGYEVYPVQTIEIPNHSLISVRSSQANANLKAAKMSSNTRISGDKYFDVTADVNVNEDFMYGFVSNNEMSAGLWSNSEYQGSHVASYITAGGASNTRVMATTSTVGSAKSVGLASTRWYYDRKINPTVNGQAKTYVVEHEIMPSAKVVITGDENRDGDIDWQDGAVAFRDIMHNPQGCEVVPELVNYRIAMNFGSMAANPFLMNLDGVKRVYLNTDGLGQGVLLKGYGSEGHDSGHPDYGDIGRRIGGADDMNTLLVEGKKMGALFGVHVNASEMYAEAKAFDDELSRGDAGINSGWNWLDQGVGINSAFDLASGRREARFKDLWDQVGNNLDFIYVDVWGNGVSGEGEDAWYSRMLAREINGLGWRLATEWGPTQEYDSTLQHWAADLGYGGFQSKGENSEVMRFLRNHQKDSWIADYPSYDGAAQMPLLGGLNMTDFEGWQARTNYKNYITVMFRHNLITKYLQHYQVVDWKDGNPVRLSTGDTWTPEMEITLRNTKDAADGTEIVVSRGSNDYNSRAQYRSRTIKLNDVVISTGAPTGGDGSNPGNETYLIPWNWDAQGKELADADKKMYHWNTQGGTTTWTLTKDWQGLSNVVVYELTDEGKTNKKTVNVVNNQITLEGMKAETPYVVYKGEKAQLSVDWQTSPYVYDMGFNDTDVNSHRTVTGNAAIVDNASQNNMLKLEGGASVSTQLTNLKPGQKYALYVGVDNRSDAKATMQVTSNEKTLGTNYTGRSFVENLVSSDQHHTGSGASDATGISYFQNMFVFFTADAETATLTLKREAGEGATYFDDLRVVETKMDVIRETDAEGNITALYNDFEENAQGIWPFVVSGPKDESGTYAASYYITDNRIHLSEKHAPYTQAGYNVKAVDDVLDGNWSVKVNALTSNNSMLYQTIPQNFHFEPGETYYVSFDYQMGSQGTYEVRVGDGANINVESIQMAANPGKTQNFGFSFTASESGNSWIGIYSTGKGADSHGLGGNMFNFSGYADFILDNIKIEKTSMKIDKTYTEVTTAADKIPLSVDFVKDADKGTEVTWKSSDESVARVDSNGDVYFVGFGSAMITATSVIGGKETTLSSTVYYPDGYLDAGGIQAWVNANQSGEGADKVLDGDPDSLWHTPWSGFEVSDSNPAIVTVKLNQDISEYQKKQFTQRGSGGRNGMVQRYQVIVGDSFNPNNHTISNPTYTSGILTAQNQENGDVEELNIPEGTKGHYLQIRVVQGYNGFAAMGEVSVYTSISYDTPEERALMQANAVLLDEKKKEEAAKKELEEAKKELGGAVAAADAVYAKGQQNYTEESWKAFADAYTAAKAGADLKDTAAVKKLASALAAAQKALKEKDALPQPPQPEPLKNGDSIKVGNILYKVTNASAKKVAAVKGTTKKLAAANIKATVKIKGVTCKVTQINPNAFKNFKKLKKVTIGKNVASIGKQSFAGCAKLAKVIFKGTAVKTVKSGAFKNVNKKVKVTLPKALKGKKRTALKNKLKKAGVKATIQ